MDADPQTTSVCHRELDSALMAIIIVNEDGRV